MIIRLLIAVAIAAAIVFIPYLIGSIGFESYLTEAIELQKWLFGFITILFLWMCAFAGYIIWSIVWAVVKWVAGK